MKEFFKMFFASLLAMIIAGVVLVGITIGMIAAVAKSFSDKTSDKVSTGDVLVLDMSKRVHENGEVNSLALFSKGSASEAGLQDITKALGRAKTDKDIKGVLIKLSSTPNGWATLQQLHAAVADFKTSGKFVYAYGENITQGAYYVATASDSIYLNPAGGIELKGFATVLAFFKGTLEKLELQPEIFYAGKFKSATEPFRADKISDPNREQLAAMQSGLWNQFITASAQYMHTDAAAVNKLAVDGTIQFPSDAYKNKMVAGLLYWDEVESRIKTKTGRSSKDDIKYVAIDEYASGNRIADKMSESKVAVLVAEGEIVDGEQENEMQIASKTFCEEIRKIAKDDKIKAVVLRVNSPGGSALASEVILRELNLLQQKKHLVVSMGDYAASGGYYISSNAEKIFAMPNTITGSIGVFGMMFNMDKLAKNKLGVTFDEVKNAPYADLPTSSRPLTAIEAQRMQAGVDSIYELFKNHVVTGRKILTKAEVDSIAQGRIWTGTDAKSLHLVDSLGGLNNAIAYVASLAKITDYRVVTYPEPTDKLEMIMKRFKNNTAASAAIKTAMKEEMGTEYSWYEKLQNLRKMSGKVLMAMPFVPEVN